MLPGGLYDLRPDSLFEEPGQAKAAHRPGDRGVSRHYEALPGRCNYAKNPVFTYRVQGAGLYGQPQERGRRLYQKEQEVALRYVTRRIWSG